MAHHRQLQFVNAVKQLFEESFKNRRVLEIGSWDKNGSVRQYFQNCDYIGIDIAEGDGVDHICEGQNAAYPSQYFDTVISCECFEHNPYWLETFINMLRMLKPDGLCIISCASIGRGEHGTKRCHQDASLTAENNFPDYYHNLERRDFESRLNLKNHFSHYSFFCNIYSKDLYFVGIKHGTQHNNTCGKLALLQKALKTQNRTSFSTMLLSHINWGYKFLFAKLLGESTYHNIKYRIKRFSRRLRGKHSLN